MEPDLARSGDSVTLDASKQQDEKTLTCNNVSNVQPELGKLILHCMLHCFIICHAYVEYSCHNITSTTKNLTELLFIFDFC